MANLTRLCATALVLVGCKSGGAGPASLAPTPAETAALAAVPDSVVAGCPRAQVDLGAGERPYYEFMVTEPAQPTSPVTPSRPPELIGRHGTLQLMYVIDTAGTVDFKTVKFALPGSAADSAYAKSACRALALTRFRPARINGRAVRMWMQQPFAY